MQFHFGAAGPVAGAAGVPVSIGGAPLSASGLTPSSAATGPGVAMFSGSALQPTGSVTSVASATGPAGTYPLSGASSVGGAREFVTVSSAGSGVMTHGIVSGGSSDLFSANRGVTSTVSTVGLMDMRAESFDD